MKNKPVFSLSKALIVENFKMYWYVPALAFITYFMAGIFPILVNSEWREILMNPEDFPEHSIWYFEDLLNNWNVAFALLLVVLPFVTAMLMMGYLHNPVKSIAIHAQPFSRNKIFCSHTLTGWLMCVIPAALTAILLMLVAGHPTGVVEWLMMTVIVMTFFYGLFTLAGSLTGNSVMHLLLCGIFFGIVPLVIWIAMMFCEGFLDGFYNIPEDVVEFMCWSNPMLEMLTEGDGTNSFTVMQSAGYLITGFAMLVLAYVAYSRAKLERVGDSMLYKVIEELITWLVVFVGMAAFGYFFYEIMDMGKAMLLVGMAFGTLLTFVVVKIVLARSIKIINKENLVSLGIYAIIAVLFTSITVYDITGFAKKVPDIEDVASVSKNHFRGYSDDFYYSYFADGYIENDNLDQPETVEKILALHQYIVDNDLYDRERTGGAVEVYDTENGTYKISNMYITFEYNLKNGKTMQRRFCVQLDQTFTDMFNDILTTEEFKTEGNLSEKIQAKDVQYVQINTQDHSVYNYIYEKYGDEGLIDPEKIEDPDFKGWSQDGAIVLIEDEKEIEEFLAAVREDYYNRTYTLKPSGEFVSSTEETGYKLDTHCEIYMKPSFEGSRKTMIAINDNPNSYGPAVEEVVITKPSDDMLQAYISFSVRTSDSKTISILRGLYERKGYDYYAKRFEKYIK